MTPRLALWRTTYEAKEETLVRYSVPLDLPFEGTTMLDPKTDIAYVSTAAGQDGREIEVFSFSPTYKSFEHLVIGVSMGWREQWATDNNDLNPHYCAMLDCLLNCKNLQTLMLMLVPLRMEDQTTPQMSSYNNITTINALRNPLANWPKVPVGSLPDANQLIGPLYIGAINHHTASRGWGTFGPPTLPKWIRDFLSHFQRQIDRMAVANSTWKKPIVKVTIILLKQESGA